ncbi:MAG: hypothetical protein WCY01_12510 [Alkalispirochaeta sp.]|jgi:hypothetical protein
MSLQPIDLQTLFVRLSQIGREQSALKQAVAQNQTVTGNEIAQKSQNAGNTVREPDEVSEGPETVKEDGQREKSEYRSASDEEQLQEHPESTESEQEFRDPDLGQNIDVTG